MSEAAANENKDKPSNRWWESYLVRYFAGFIVGCVCIVIIGVSTGLARAIFKVVVTDNTLPKPDWSALVFLVAFLGIGFCYIASSPITVLHVGRYRNGWFDGNSRFFWLGWGLLLFLVGGAKFALPIGIQCFVFIMVFAVIHGDYRDSKQDSAAYRQRRLLGARMVLKRSVFSCFALWAILDIVAYIGFGGRLPQSVKLWWLLAMPVFWILIGQYAVLFRMLTEEEKFLMFYKKLIFARSRPNSRDVRDTYTHLREHSNSVFIVVIELSLLALFMAADKSSAMFSHDRGGYESLLFSGILGMFLWMIPTVFMWSRANRMEADFSENPYHYLNK